MKWVEERIIMVKGQRVIPGEQDDGVGRRAKERFMRRMA